MMEVERIKNLKFVNLYEQIIRASESFSRLSPNIPKQCIEIVQHIHGRFDTCIAQTSRAANADNVKSKRTHLHMVIDSIVEQSASIELLVNNKCISIGQCNEILIELSNSYEQACKWLKYLEK